MKRLTQVNHSLRKVKDYATVKNLFSERPSLLFVSGYWLLSLVEVLLREPSRVLIKLDEELLHHDQ